MLKMSYKSLFLKIMILHAISAELNVPSSAKPLPRIIRASVADLYQTSQSISAHARLVNGFYLQASLLNPATDTKELVSELLNIDLKTFNGLLVMDSSKLSEVIDSLKNSSTIPEGDLEVFREGLDHMAKIRDDWASAGDPSTEEQRQKLYDAIGAFQKVEMINFDGTIAMELKGSMEKLSTMTPDLTQTTGKTEAAQFVSELVQKFQSFFDVINKVEKVNDWLTPFEPISNAASLFRSTQLRINIQKEYSEPKLVAMRSKLKMVMGIGLMLSNMDSQTVLQNVAIVKRLIKRRSRIDRKYTGAFPGGLSDLDLLSSDIKKSVLRTTLNNGEDISELEKTLEPLFQFQKQVNVLNQNIQSNVNKKDLENGCDLLENLFNKIITAGSSTEAFNVNIGAVDAASKLAGTVVIDQSVTDAELMLEKVTEFRKKFMEFQSALVSFKDTGEILAMKDMNDWMDSLNVAMTDGIAAGFNNVKTHTKVPKILQSLEPIITSMNTFKDQFSQLRTDVSTLSDLKTLVNAAESSTKQNLDTFISSLLPAGPQIDAVKAGIVFGIDLKKQFKDQSSFSTVSKAFLDLDQSLEKGMGSIEAEVAEVRKKQKDEFVKMMSEWKNGKKIEEGLIAGMTLFKTFEKVHRNKTLLEDLTKKGKLLDNEIETLTVGKLRDEVRKKWRGDFDAVSTKIGKMIGDVEKLKLGNDTDLKSLGATIELAAMVTDPGVNLADWKEATEQLKQANSSGTALSDVTATLNSIEDLNLNFASATSFVKGMGGILPDLQKFVVKKLRSPGTTTPSVNESPDFFEQYKLWLIIGICVLAAMFLLIGIAIFICVMKKKKKKKHANRASKTSSTTNQQMVPLLKETTAKDKTAKKRTVEKGLDPTQKTDKKGMIGLDRTQDEQVEEQDDQAQDGQQRKLAAQLPNFRSFLEKLLPSINLVTVCVPVYKGYKASLNEFFEMEIAEEKRTAGQEQLSQRAKKFVMGMFKGGGSSKTLNVEQRIEKETKSLQIIQPNSFIATPTGDLWYICSWPQDTSWWPDIFKQGIEHVVDLSGGWHRREMNPWSRVHDKKVNIRSIDDVIPGVLLREVTHTDFPMQRIRLTLFEDFPIGMAPFSYEQLLGVYMSCAHKNRPVAVVDRWGTSAACVFPMINMMIDMIGEKGTTEDFKLIGEKMLLTRKAPINMVTSIQIELAALIAFAYIEHKYSENPTSVEMIKGLHIDYKGSWMDDSERWKFCWDAAFQQEKADPMTHWFDIMTNEADMLMLWASYKRRYVPDEKAKWTIEKDMKARNRNTLNRLADYGNDNLDF